MEMNSREYYLNHVWPPYPEMPSVAAAYGRIFALERGKALDAAAAGEGPSLTLQLVKEGKTSRVHFERAPAYSEFLVEGDIVAVMDPTEIKLLAPLLKPLPRAPFDPVMQKKWLDFVSSLRNFFSSQRFFEIQTPKLVKCPGTEPSLDVFSTELKLGTQIEKLYLPTSPELHLKKVLALGAENIFEIASCFRNGEVTDTHQPEFTMLEWYRAYQNLGSIKNDVQALVHFMADKWDFPYPQKVSAYSVAELFKQYCQFEFKPQTTLEELKELALKLGVDVHAAESIDDYFYLIFMEKIESQLPPGELTFVEKYPPYQAALARIDADGWGERFEVYWRGLEIANAFHELNDPVIQRRRFDEDLERKAQLGKEIVALDDEFLQCLEAGMPPSAGIALGVERLFMAFHEVKNIRDLKIFPRD